MPTASRIAVLFLLAFAMTPAVRSADRASDESLSGWQRLFREHAAEYTIDIAGVPDSRVSLIADPVLKWSQPVRGGAEGGVYLWTQHGIPVAIATLFIWPAGQGRQGVAHELHSLFSRPLKATWRDRSWTPPANAVAWQTLKDAPVPSTADQRMRQMRELARQFRVNSRDRNNREWELRLLPRPIYRYEVKPVDAPAIGKIIDGGLFGFVEGTDLEAVLLIQARETEAQPVWEFAWARMSDFRLTARRGERIVWDVEPSGPDKPNEAYHCSTVEYRTSPEVK